MANVDWSLIEAVVVLLLGAAVQWGVMSHSLKEFEKKMDSVWGRFQTLDANALLAAGHDGQVEARLRVVEAAVAVGASTREELIEFRAESRILIGELKESRAESTRSLASLSSQMRELAKIQFEDNTAKPRRAHG